MGAVSVWHGSEKALRVLQEAVEHNCTCDPDNRVTCAPHKMLSDQRVLDHFAFVSTSLTDYIDGEFDPVGEWF